MESIGQQLKAARERKGATPSQAAAATHLKVQHVEALERDDYSRLTVPTYAKGFLKIYAEFLGLDPAPLLRDYALRQAPATAPTPTVAPPPSGSTFKAPRRVLPAAPRLPSIPPDVLRQLAMGAIGIVLVVVLLLAIRHGCSRLSSSAAPTVAPVATPVITNQTPEKREKPAPWVIVNEPPPPYYKRPAAPTTP